MFSTLNQRFADKRLHLKHTYRFRWAHKPLCRAFSADVLRAPFGIFLCRSCTFLYFGVALGAISLISQPIRAHSAPIAIVLLVAVLGFSHPRFYKKWPRRFRDFLRLGLGALLPLGMAVAIWSSLLVAALAALTVTTTWILYSRRRKQRKRKACDSCPEYKVVNPCSGFALQTQLLSRYQQEATQRLLHSGYVPEIVQRAHFAVATKHER